MHTWSLACAEPLEAVEAVLGRGIVGFFSSSIEDASMPR